MERKTGYYWIKLKRLDEPEVAYWCGEQSYMFRCGFTDCEYEYDVISERLDELSTSASNCNLDIVTVSETAVCANCGDIKGHHSKTTQLCAGQFSHFKQTER